MSAEVKDYYVSPHAKVEGAVRFGTGCVVLAGARVTAAGHAELCFGNYCLIEEYASVHVAAADGEDSAAARQRGTPTNHVVTVGQCNVFAARSRVAHIAEGIGEGNVFQPFCSVDGVRSIGDFNVFTAFTVVDARAGRTAALERVASRCTVTMSAAPLYAASRVAATDADDDPRSLVVMPRDGTRSVAELPSLAQSLLAVAADEAVLAAHPDEEHLMSSGSDVSGAEDGVDADADGRDSSSNEADASHTSASFSFTSLAAADTVTPPKQRLPAQHIEGAVASPPRGHPGSSHSHTKVSPATVQALLAALPEQTEKAAVQDVMKKCRYYLTLYAVL